MMCQTDTWRYTDTATQTPLRRVLHSVGSGAVAISIWKGELNVWGLAYSCWYLPEWLLVLFYFVTISAATAGNNKNANKSLDFPIEVFSPPRPSDNYSFLYVCVWVCASGWRCCCWCYCLLLPVSVLLVSFGMLFRGTVEQLGGIGNNTPKKYFYYMKKTAESILISLNSMKWSRFRKY